MVAHTKVMFLVQKKFEERDAIRGAFLTTDESTTPLEFRCTGPIQPTDLQKVLYGPILEPYVLVRLIGMPLIQAAREKPDLILVRDPLLLELRTKIEIPLLCVLKETEGREQKAEGRLPMAYGPLPSEQRDRLDLILTTIGARKEALIQALSKIQGLKHPPHQIVGQLPYPVGKNLSRETAQKIRAHLEKAGATVKLVPSIPKSGPSSEANSDEPILHCESGRFEPLMVMSHRDFAEDRNNQRPILHRIFKHYNLIEPFDRILMALERIHAQHPDQVPQD